MILGGYGAFEPFFVARELERRAGYVLTAKVAGKTHRFEFTTAAQPTDVP